MRQTYAATVALVIYVVSCFTTCAAQSTPLCAKPLAYGVDCAKRSSIITPAPQSWTFTVAAGSGAVVTVRFVGKHRGTVTVKPVAPAGAAITAQAHPNTFGEEVFASVTGAGQYQVEITPLYTHIPLVFLIRAQAAAKVQLAAAQQTLLAGIAKDCCTGVTSASCALLQKPADICSSPPNVCDAKGNLLSLSLVGGLSCTIINKEAEIDNLGSLISLDLSYNGIATEASALTASLFGEGNPGLVYIYMAHNKLTGIIYEEAKPTDTNAEPLTKPIKVFDFRNNSMSGTLPNSLFEQATTEEVLLGNNNFTEWNGLNAVAKAFQVLDLSHNSLTGRGFVISNPLIYLDISHNKFFSYMHSLNNTQAIVHYDTSYNNFDTEIPQSFKRAANLAYIDVSHNIINGQLSFLLNPVVVPPNPPLCTKLAHFKMNDNLMIGFIQWSIANFTQLYTLEMQNNRFQGNILKLGADIKADANQLVTFNISGNLFDDTVPDALRNLAVFSAKELPQTATASFGGLTLMQTPRIFDISNNKNISGPFPVFAVKAAANLKPMYQAKNAASSVQIEISGGSNTFDCPKDNKEGLQAQQLYAIQEAGYTCYADKDRIIGLEDALSALVPGVPSPPPPPADLYPPGPPAKADQKLKVIGICLGVGLFLAMVIAGVFAYKWRDLDLKLKSRYHKQGEDFKPSYVVSPRADVGADDQDLPGEAPPSKKQGFDGVV